MIWRALAGLRVLHVGDDMVVMGGERLQPPAEMDLRVAARSAQRRSTRSSTICETLLGISGVGQSE